jgi:hypothetical protein
MINSSLGGGAGGAAGGVGGGILGSLLSMGMQAFGVGGTSMAGGLGLYSQVGSNVASASSAAATAAGVGANVFGFASGGHVTGPGTGTSDSIPARLSNGEFVVNAAATSAHLPMLHALNGSMGSSGKSHFATGGYVGPTPNVSGGSTAITFNIGQSGGSGASPTATAASQTRSAAMQKELTASVIEIVRRHSLPGGQINQIIKTAAAR